MRLIFYRLQLLAWLISIMYIFCLLYCQNMSILYLIGLFVLGAIFGSFGSVILTRMRYKITWPIVKWFVMGRSQCPECKHALKRYDLIPIYSWFTSWGRCAHCGAKISSMYPTLEIVSGLIFVLWWVMYFLPGLMWRDSWHIVILISRWLLGLLLVRDIYTYELHVPVWFMLVVVQILYMVFALWSGFARWSMLLVPLAFFGLFLLVYWFGRWYVRYRYRQAQEWFWQWDVMLAPVLGFLFVLWGFAPLEIVWLINFVLVFVLWSSAIGLLYYAGSWVWHRSMHTLSKRHSTGSAMIPFLPAMIICYWVMVIIRSIGLFSL